MKYKSMVLIVILLVLTIFLTTCGESKVEFDDPGLEQAIREAINKPFSDISARELKELKKLDAAWNEIISLIGIENCTSLEWLDLRNTHINDLSPLVNLNFLRVLYLKGNPLNEESKNNIIPKFEKNGVLVF